MKDYLEKLTSTISDLKKKQQQLENYWKLLDEEQKQNLVEKKQAYFSSNYPKLYPIFVRYAKEDYRLYCKICGKEKFLSEFSFRLHCDALHNLEFPTYETMIGRGFALKKSTLISSPPMVTSYSNSSGHIIAPEKKRLIIGNTSTFVPEKMREANDYTTHKWLLYIRGPIDEPDLSFIKNIRIILDESFQPNHIIDMAHPPFHIKRRAYSDFNLKVQIFMDDFVEDSKMIEVNYYLQLDKEDKGTPVISPETHVQVALIRSRNPLVLFNNNDRTSSAVTSKTEGMTVDAIDEDGGRTAIHSNTTTTLMNIENHSLTGSALPNNLQRSAKTIIRKSDIASDGNNSDNLTDENDDTFNGSDGSFN